VSKETTHFGFETIPAKTKKDRVASVFTSVADQYDLMNDLMSLGLHRIWKKIAIQRAMIEPDQLVLDLAGGTGDLSQHILSKLKGSGHVILSDINNAMLKKGQQRFVDIGITKGLSFAQSDAEVLPFPNNTFDRVMMGFGLRNVTHKEKALQEICRVLKPMGRAVILEFSKVSSPLFQSLYHQYSFSVIPKLGQWICQDPNSYQYLVESIEVHPDQETLRSMFLEAGFNQCDYQNLQGGIVALHVGYKN